MTLQRKCDFCGTGDFEVSRYSMQHKQRVSASVDVAEGNSSLSMGGIDLCDKCWTGIARPRMLQYISGLTECDMCESDEATLRLTLKQSRRIDGKVVDRGRGSIVLCLTCWEHIGLPNMRVKAQQKADPSRVFLLNAHRAKS